MLHFCPLPQSLLCSAVRPNKTNFHTHPCQRFHSSARTCNCCTIHDHTCLLTHHNISHPSHRHSSFSHTQRMFLPLSLPLHSQRCSSLCSLNNSWHRIRDWSVDRDWTGHIDGDRDWMHIHKLYHHVCEWCYRCSLYRLFEQSRCDCSSSSIIRELRCGGCIYTHSLSAEHLHHLHHW